MTFQLGRRAGGKSKFLVLIAICSIIINQTIASAAIPVADNANSSGQTAAKKRRKAGSVGNARGYVIDAATGAYLKEAKVELVLPSDIETVRDSNASTTKEGYFQFRAPLGRISSRFDAGRFLMSSPLAILGGSAKHTERFVGITQLSLRISHPGYKPFYGVVGVHEASGEEFSVWLQPVALAPESASYASCVETKPRLGHIDDVTLSSVTPQPGEKVLFSFHTTALPTLPGKKVRFRIAVEDPSTEYSDKTSGKTDGASDDPGTVNLPWQGDFGVDPKQKPEIRQVLFNYDNWDFQYRPSFRRWIAVGVPPETRSAVETLVQQMNAAESAYDKGNSAAREVQERLREKILTLWPGADPDQAVRQLESAHHFSEALTLFRQAKLKDKIHEGDLLIAQGLYGDATKVLKQYKEYHFAIYQCAELAGVVERKPEDLQSHLALARFTAGLRPDSDLVGPAGTEAKARLWNLATANMPATQNASEQVQLSRFLLAQQKYPEAIAAAKSAETDAEIGEAARLQHAAALYATGDFDGAFALYDGVIGDGSRAKDFYARHNFSLVLLKKGRYDRAAALLAKNVDDAHGKKSNDTAFNGTIFYGRSAYTLLNGPSRSSIVGYSYPEAANEALLAQTIGANENPGADWLQTAVHCRALAESGLNTEALTLLKRLTAAVPAVRDEPEVLLVQALAQIGAGDRPGAWETAKRLQTTSSQDGEVKNLIASLSDQQVAEAKTAQERTTAAQAAEAKTTDAYVGATTKIAPAHSSTAAKKKPKPAPKKARTTKKREKG